MRQVRQLLEPGPPGFLPLVALEALRDWLDMRARIAELEGVRAALVEAYDEESVAAAIRQYG
jgi:hypothetical protein